MMERKQATVEIQGCDNNAERIVALLLAIAALAPISGMTEEAAVDGLRHAFAVTREMASAPGETRQ
jgi:hypothetical protein